MARVSFSEALGYGFSLIGYLLAVGLVGGGLVFLGSVMGTAGIIGTSSDTAILGIFFGVMTVLLGWLTIIAGLYGAFYKVIADGVNRGTNAASKQPTELRVYSPTNPSNQGPADLDAYKLSNVKGKW